MKTFYCSCSFTATKLENGLDICILCDLPVNPLPLKPISKAGYIMIDHSNITPPQIDEKYFNNDIHEITST